MKRKFYPSAGKMISLLAAVCLSLSWLNAAAQTASCVVVQNPCNGDGILTINTTGMTAPITCTFNDPNGTTVIISSGSSGTFYYLEYSHDVMVVDFNSNYAWALTGFTPPFTVDYPAYTAGVCPAYTTVTLTINSGTATPFMVEWYTNMGSFAGSVIGATPYATGNPMALPNGQYYAKVFNGPCYMYADSLIWVENISPVNLTFSSTTANCNNGTATVTPTGGVSPYTYSWGPSSTITGLHTGNYSVTVTDYNGCTAYGGVYVPQSVQIGANMVITQIPTCLQNNGKVMSFGSGGVSPYSYLYSDSQNTQEATGLSGGTSLGVTVTDNNGCTGTGSIYLYSSTPIMVSYASTPSSCTSPTGTATLTISGGNPGPGYDVLWYTYPTQTTNPAVNLAPGLYGFRVTDDDGCVQTGSVRVFPVSTINAGAYSIDPICPATTGTVGVACTGTNPPFTYLWTPTSAITPTVSGVPFGYYSCHITDIVGCSVTKGTYLSAQSPISVGITSTPADCIYAANGSLLAVPTGGSGSYSYYWSNGSTSNPATGLKPGHYWVYVHDNVTGCYSEARWCSVGNSATSTACYCTVEGYVVLDNGVTPCFLDPGELGVEHVQVHLASFGSTFTDATGHFAFNVPTGTYTLSEVVQYTYPLTTPCTDNDPVTFSVTAGTGICQSHNFFNVVNPLRDAHVITFNDNAAIPGNTYRQKLLIGNDGTIAEGDIYLNYYDDPQLIGMTTIPPILFNSGSFWENYPNSISKNPGQHILLTNSFPVPPNIPLGTLLSYTSYVSYEPPITHWLDDYTPWNNLNNFQTAVIGSYDPNFKEVTPKGTGAEGTISKNDSVLDYVVHFQNTGTYYAENIEVIDTLDSDLDWTSIRLGGSSHPYTAELTGANVLKFRFSNIHLVWKAENEINSNGFVTYSINQKPNLAIGTQIKNSAAIFFDYNQPVITETTLNTIGYPVGSEVKKNQELSVYPNPVSSILYMNTGEQEKPLSLKVYDITGRLVSTGNIVPGPVQRIDVKDLASGVYLLEIINADGGRATRKFVKD
ncbi:MAG: T9SS type A sorting domain-containing protein [Bacteroidetes bacterium]|nr:T9SS type A sorting domain-containing protein [Bacteroidota bacterium]